VTVGECRERRPLEMVSVLEDWENQLQYVLMKRNEEKHCWSKKEII